MNVATILEAAAITIVITYGSIFEGLRTHGPKGWQRFWNCPLCVGFWVGAFGWGFQQDAARLLEHTHGPIRLVQVFEGFGHGALAGTLALLVKLVLLRLDG